MLQLRAGIAKKKKKKKKTPSKQREKNPEKGKKTL
jgi:hypothetical protein